MEGKDMTLEKDGDEWAIYDPQGQKVAVVLDEKQGKLLVDCYNLSAFLFR